MTTKQIKNMISTIEKTINDSDNYHMSVLFNTILDGDERGESICENLNIMHKKTDALRKAKYALEDYLKLVE